VRLCWSAQMKASRRSQESALRASSGWRSTPQADAISTGAALG
jgi:hypothetical protein